MKESTGELVAALAVIVAVGIFIAFFYYTLWPIVKSNFDGSNQCSRMICEKCTNPSGCDTVTCYQKGHFGEEEYGHTCVFRG